MRALASITSVTRVAAVTWATLTLGSCGDPAVVVPETLAVVTILPTHGASDVVADVVPLVYFSQSVGDTAAAAAAVDLACLGAPPCSSPTAATCVAPLIAVTFEDARAQVATITPSAPLLDDTCYAIVVGEGIEAQDSDIGPLPVEVRSSFKTRP